MSDLLELAARCEAAERRSHELNLAIFRALNPEYADEETWQPYGLGVRHKYDSSDARCLPPTEATAASYTASLDAAMTLIDDSEIWGVSKQEHNPGRDYYYQASVMPFGPKPWHEANAATPALALCAAALKARAASPEVVTKIDERRVG